MINKSSLMPEPKIVCDWISENNIGVINYDTIKLNPFVVMDYFSDYKLNKKPIKDMGKISDQYFNEIGKRNKGWDKNDKTLAKKIKLERLDDRFKEY